MFRPLWFTGKMESLMLGDWERWFSENAPEDEDEWSQFEDDNFDEFVNNWMDENAPDDF
jgi:hypothetical protein